MQLPSLPLTWRSPARSNATIAIGEKFIAECIALALAVPSVVVPQERNYLINPLHRRFGTITITKQFERFAFDERIFAPSP